MKDDNEDNKLLLLLMLDQCIPEVISFGCDVEKGKYTFGAVVAQTIIETKCCGLF